MWNMTKIVKKIILLGTRTSRNYFYLFINRVSE